MNITTKSFNTPAKWFKSIPWYGIVAGLVCIYGFQSLLYYIVNKMMPHNNGWWVGIAPVLPSIDEAIPLVPYFFAQMYVLWHFFFPVGAIIASAKITYKNNKEQWINLIISWMTAILIGGLILIFLPTYLDRTNIPGVPGGDILEFIKDKNSFSWQIERLIAKSGNYPYDYGCAPSYHCLEIIFCYFAVMGRKDRNIGHRIGWLFIAISICLSTVFVKQHYFIDILAAIILAFICFFAIKAFNPGKAILKKCPNFLIVKKLNWCHEVIHTKIEKTKSIEKNK